MPRVVEQREINSAEDLINELAPTSKLWRHQDGRPCHVIFRGQANGPDGRIWDLTPSAWRPKAFDRFQSALYMPGSGAGAQDHRLEEEDAALSFGGWADAHGFVIPGDHSELRDPRARRHLRAAADAARGLAEADPTNEELARAARDAIAAASAAPDFRAFPDPELVALFGLAQHHGVPTRLLDWTSKPYSAAYFAAKCVAERRRRDDFAGGDAPFSLFVLKDDVRRACERLDPAILILTVPTASNANLRAQGGRFTLVQPVGNDLHPLPSLRAVLEAHAAAGSIPSEHEDLFPLLVELRVPATEACATMFLLSQLGVNAATVYPGLDGVVEAMREMEYHQSGASSPRW